MKALLAFSVCFAYVFGQNQIVSPPTATRDLPANVERSNPNACYAVTQNKSHGVGESWSLRPFCGRATCVRGAEGLLERVEDCGRGPKESPGCKFINEADLQKDFPVCCPKFECQPGSQLLYPTDEELKAAFEAAQANRQQGGQSGQANPQGR